MISNFLPHVIAFVKILHLVYKKTNEKLDNLLSFTIKGTPIHTKWAFIATLVFSILMYIISHNLYNTLFILLYMLLLYKNVLLHELGHVYCAARYGIKTHRVSLHFFGGTAFLDFKQLPPLRHILIALAGPATNLAQLILEIPLWVYLAGINSNFTGISFIKNFLLIDIFNNVMMFGFNLLPLYPSDGGRVFRSILELIGIAPKSALKIALSVTFTLGIAISAFTSLLLSFYSGIMVGLVIGLLASYGLAELQIIENRPSKIYRLMTSNETIIEELIKYYSERDLSAISFGGLIKFVKEFELNQDNHDSLKWVGLLDEDSLIQIGFILRDLGYINGDVRIYEIGKAALSVLNSNTNLRFALYTYQKFLQAIFVNETSECKLNNFSVEGECGPPNNVFTYEDSVDKLRKYMHKKYGAAICLGEMGLVLGLVFEEDT